MTDKPLIPQKKRSKHYINNKDFYLALCEYLGRCDEAEGKGLPLPVIPDYIGKAFMHMSTRIASKPNFINYSYKDDMICDAIENCVKQIRSFDPRYTNPFAYFSTVIHNAFIRRIKTEKKEQDIKIESLEILCVHDEIAGAVQSKQFFNEVTHKYKSKDKKKPKKKAAATINQFVEVEVEESGSHEQ